MALLCCRQLNSRNDKKRDLLLVYVHSFSILCNDPVYGFWEGKMYDKCCFLASKGCENAVKEKLNCTETKSSNKTMPRPLNSINYANR